MYRPRFLENWKYRLIHGSVYFAQRIKGGESFENDSVNVTIPDTRAPLHIEY